MTREKDDKLAAINVGRPSITVRHAGLERVGNGRFKSLCPSCGKGVLPVRRDPATLELLAEDSCLLCSQRFSYSDLGGPSSKGHAPPRRS